jgi:hypothetical protein
VSAYFGADPFVVASGGTIFMTKDVGFSPGPKGPGTLFPTGGRLLSNAQSGVCRTGNVVRAWPFPTSATVPSARSVDQRGAFRLSSSLRME